MDVEFNSKAVTQALSVGKTQVTTTFTRIRETGVKDQYQLTWVLDNNGKDQETSNGTTTLSPVQYAALLAANANTQIQAIPIKEAIIDGGIISDTP